MRNVENNVQVEITASTPRSRRAEKYSERIAMGSLVPLLASTFMLNIDSLEKLGWVLGGLSLAVCIGAGKTYFGLHRSQIEAEEYVEENPTCEVFHYEHARLRPVNMVSSGAQ